jgi:hypothetical protein
VSDNLDLVVRSIRRTRNKLGLGFLVILAIGVGLVYGGVASEEGGIGITIFGAFCVLLALFGAKIIWPNLRPSKAPLVRLLRERPENVAWIYDTPDPGPRGRTITHTIHVHDTDKRGHTFMVKVAEVGGMMETLKSFAPRATFGPSKENETKYKQDPWSMISDS